MSRRLAATAVRALVATLVVAAAVAGPGCASPQPLPPSEAAKAVDETRAAAGLPPSADSAPPEAPSEEEAEPAPPAEAASAAAARGEAVALERLVEEKESAKERGATDPTVVRIGSPASEEQPKTLAEAAAAAREKRRLEGRPKATLVINDENLAAFAAEGQLTVVSPGSTPPAEAAGEAPAATGAAGAPGPERGPAGPRDEDYWRGRTRDVRTRWADAAAEVERLEGQAAQLRWDFYAEDDPYYRDERIKPEWDRVLDQLRRARQDIRAYREELAEVIDEGRRAGALPGWLRDGIELEPEEPASPIRREPTDHDVSEPTVYGQGERP